MNNILGADIFPGAKLVQETVLKTMADQSSEDKLDFAAILTGLMMGQLLNQSNAMVEPAKSTGTTEQPFLDNLLLSEGLVKGGFERVIEQNQILQSSLMNDFVQNIDNNINNPLEAETASEADNNFEQVLRQGLSKNVVNNILSQELVSDSDSKELLPLGLKQMAQKHPGITNQRMEHGVKEVDLEQQIEQFGQIEQEKQPVKQVKQDLQPQQDLNWRADSFYDQLYTAKTTEVSHKETMLPKQLESVIQQLVDQSKLSISKGKSEVEIKLKPEYLGKVHMKVVLEKGILTARLAVESLMVGKALENNLNQLKNHMQEQGLNFSQVNVEMGSGTLEHNSKESSYGQEQFKGFSSEASSEENSEDIKSTNIGLGGVNYLA